MSRVLTTGFEFSATIDNGLLSVDSEVSITTTQPRKSVSNNGGSRALEANTTGTNLITFQPFPYELPASHSRLYFRMATAATTHEYIFYDDAGSTEIFKLRLISPTGPLTLSVNSVDVATGTKTFLTDTYYSLKVSAVISAVGSIDVTIDSTIDISFSGVTNGGGTGWDQLRLNTDGRVFYDDIGINDEYTRVNYSGGNGSIPSGALAGTAPGTATIINQVGDGVTGYLIIEKGSGSFIDGDTLTGGAFTGTVNGDEDLTSTSSLSDGFVELFFPDGDGNSSELTNSNGNSVNNYTYTNTFEDTSTFVSDSVGGLTDTYTMNDMHAEAVGVNHVDAYFYTKRDGATVTKIRSALRIGSNDYESHTEDIPVTSRWVGFSYQENPDSKAPWVVSDIDSLESGPKLEP